MSIFGKKKKVVQYYPGKSCPNCGSEQVFMIPAYWYQEWKRHDPYLECDICGTREYTTNLQDLWSVK
jgi:transcription elongation factor Elf1